MNRNLLLVALSMFTWGAGEGLFFYFQPLYLQEWGADPILIGALIGATGIAMGVAQIPAGLLSDRFGARTLMWASWFIGTIACWIMALAGSLPVFIVGMVTYGLSSFAIAPLNSYITTVRGKWSPARAMTLVSGCFHLGAVLGPVIGGRIAEAVGLKTVYLISAFIFIFSTGIVLAIAPKRDEPAGSSEHANGHILKNRTFVLFSGLMLVTVFSLYLPQPFTPSFLQNQQMLSRQMIGILGSIGSLGNALSTLLLGNLIPPIGFLVGQLLVALAAVFMWKGTSVFWFGAGYFLFGGFRLSRIMALAYIRPMVRPGQVGLAYGIMETFNALAVLLAPMLAGILYRSSPVSIYQVAFAAILAAAGLNAVFLWSASRQARLEKGTASS